MRFRTAVLCLMATACGGNDDDGGGSGLDGTCSLRAEVSGATSIEFTGMHDAVCVTQHSFGSGLDATFGGAGDKGMLELSIAYVREGETGDDYMARIIVTSAAKERWQGIGCIVSITEHDLVEVEASEIGELRRYQVAATGGCAEALQSVPAGGEPVNVPAFGFRARFTWRD